MLPGDGQNVTKSESQLRIALLTAGAANMYCGSCLSDNAIARAMMQRGADVLLLPLYTPLRIDGMDASIDRVFLGGINVYLDQNLPLYRWLPARLVRWLNRPALLRWVSRRRISTDAAKLGPMCVSMLQGMQGRMQREVAELVDFLAQQVRPHVVSFSNVMIAGSAKAIKERLNAVVVVMLQGDDIFLRQIPQPYQKQALAEIQEIDSHIDVYLAHSRFYADKMAEYLGIARTKIRIVPLGVPIEDLRALASSYPAEKRTMGQDAGKEDAIGERAVQEHARESRPSHEPTSQDGERFRIGYLARLAPEKGLHLACDAVEHLCRQRPDLKPQLRVAGWLGPENESYAKDALRRLQDSFPDAIDHVGEVDRDGKWGFLQQIDLLCVPSPYEEPKGLYALEALAAGVPVVSPDHGAFPELASETGGLVLFPAGDIGAIAQRLLELADDPARRIRLGQNGQSAVLERHSSLVAADAILKLFRQLSHDRMLEPDRTAESAG